MSLLKSLFVIGLSLNILLLNGCSYFAPYTPTLTQGTIIKPDHIDLLQPGLTEKQVESLLGPKLGQDAFAPKHWSYVFYTTGTEFDKSLIKHLEIEFDDEGYLESWKIEDKEVTLKKKGFFEKLIDS